MDEPSSVAVRQNKSCVQLKICKIQKVSQLFFFFFLLILMHIDEGTMESIEKFPRRKNIFLEIEEHVEK